MVRVALVPERIGDPQQDPRAKKIQDKRRRQLEEGAAGIKKRQQPLLFSVAAEGYLGACMSRKTKKKWLPNMLEMQQKHM